MKIGRWTVLGSVVESTSSKRKWLCRCDCGTERYVLERSLLYGGSSSCGCLRREKALETISHDLTGQIFEELTVIHKAEHQRKNGGVWWTCQCTCGNTIDVSYNCLVYSSMKNCGCQKIEHNGKLQENLTCIDGTSLDMIKCRKVFANSTTGYRGVYFIRGKYVAKIVFQQKAYYLGSYDNIADAVNVRKEAEDTIFGGTTAYYEKWNEAVKRMPGWAEENTIQIEIGRDSKDRLTIKFDPPIEEITELLNKGSQITG